MNSEPEIPVDDLKIFADKTRVTILKMLNERKHTVSELSRALNLSKPTILYHMKILENAGYVKRIEDGRKWIYYEVTDSGRSVLKWRKLRIILPVISIAASAILTFTAVLLRTMKRKSIPEYPAMGAQYDWLLLISVTALIISLIAFVYTKRGRR
ncbi:metalloregulator ArsR/SmtB family transcription factor [Geoglobus acetivorans]|uniref:Winged helix-turn-helix domain-containing protein n=1 Tax=Geoglobus acetivorans TaxID=565033 RepID=A0ABZ3H4B7_GEOAI|nr:winged helix-turn-helix transcriptional regulator [Geoglobus acetivorans]